MTVATTPLLPEARTDKPLRCLHVVESLDRGAVENWLVRMLRHARSTNTAVDWTFYCIIPQEGALDSAVRELGARVVHSPVPISQTLAFTRALRSELLAGRYSVLHAHHDLINAVYLVASMGTGVRKIAHIHNADEALPTGSRLKKLAYREPMRRVCLSLADRIVGISQHTLDTFLAGRSRLQNRDFVHYYGVDPSPYLETQTEAGFRAANDIDAEAEVVLFAGRMVPEKNPVFAADVLGELTRIRKNVIGVFAGDGSEQAAARARVTRGSSRQHTRDERIIVAVGVQ